VSSHPAAKPSLPHLQHILAVLEALGSISPAYGAVVCEDVYVALTLAASMGLTLEQVKEQQRAIIAEFNP
jgi:hypothetical protein